MRAQAKSYYHSVTMGNKFIPSTVEFMLFVLAAHKLGYNLAPDHKGIITLVHKDDPGTFIDITPITH